MFGQSAKSVWEEIRPLAEDVLKTCRTDDVLTIHLEKLIPTFDSCVARGLKFTPYMNTITAIDEVLNSATYYQNLHKNSSKEETDKIRKLGEQIGVLRKMMAHESRIKPDEVLEEDTRERLPNLDSDASKITNMYKRPEEIKGKE